MTMSKVAIASDDVGFALKEQVKTHLEVQGIDVVDYGCNGTEPVDYPDVALRLAQDIAAHRAERGILICGTGIGMAIAANKVPGVSAAQAHDPHSAARARKSNNAQILTMRARVIAGDLAKSIVGVWMASEFEGGNSARKVDKIAAFDVACPRGTDSTAARPETEAT